MKINKITDKIKKFISFHIGKIKFIGNFFLMIILYGLVVNFMLWSIFNVTFNWFSFIGYGIMAYLIKIEFPVFINGIFQWTRGIVRNGHNR